MCRVRTTGLLHEPELFNFKLCLMRQTDHFINSIMYIEIDTCVVRKTGPLLPPKLFKVKLRLIYETD